MIISFFEEFPTKKNLAKLSFINFPTKIYLAAKSLKEFNTIRSSIKNKYVQEVIYWPTLEKKEGYWISPFSKRQALKRIFAEANHEAKDVPIMLDLELPTTQNPWLYFTQFYDFFSNKRLIQKFINNYNNDIYLAEYYPCGKIKEALLELLGLHFSPSSKKMHIIKMAYHSMHHFDRNKFTALIKEGKREFSKKYLVAFGTIAKGITTHEPLLTPQQLKEDLTIAKKTGISEVIIFRLGGLDKGYLSVLR